MLCSNQHTTCAQPSCWYTMIWDRPVCIQGMCINARWRYHATEPEPTGRESHWAGPPARAWCHSNECSPRLNVSVCPRRLQTGHVQQHLRGQYKLPVARRAPQCRQEFQRLPQICKTWHIEERAPANLHAAATISNICRCIPSKYATCTISTTAVALHHSTR